MLDRILQSARVCEILGHSFEREIVFGALFKINRHRFPIGKNLVYEDYVFIISGSKFSTGEAETCM